MIDARIFLFSPTLSEGYNTPVFDQLAATERLGLHGEQITNVVTSNLFSKPVIDWEEPEVTLRPSLQPGWEKRKC